MMPWDVPGGIVGCYMRYRSGEWDGKNKASIRWGRKKNGKGAGLDHVFAFRFVFPSTHSPTTWQIPGGGLPFEPGTGILVGTFRLNPAVKDY